MIGHHFYKTPCFSNPLRDIRVDGTAMKQYVCAIGPELTVPLNIVKSKLFESYSLLEVLSKRKK